MESLLVEKGNKGLLNSVISQLEIDSGIVLYRYALWSIPARSWSKAGVDV
jgi:hypothetical protein